MRKLAPLVPIAVLLCLAAPTAGGAPTAEPRAAIFYYPWYSAPPRDLSYRHWSQAGHDPPNDIASNYYPARGAYSSSSPTVLRDQMRDIAGAGVGEVVSSWWGIDSSENVRLWPVVRAAR